MLVEIYAMKKQDYPNVLKRIQDGDLEALKSLLAQSDDPSFISSCQHAPSGDTAAIVAARNGRSETLELLYRKGVDLEKRNKDGKRPLHEAASAGSLECVQFLISKGVEIDCLKRADWTPLMMACTKSNLFIIKELIAAGASAHRCNKDGWNSFHIAAREGHRDILQYFLEEFPMIWRSKSKNGRTPLHTAAFHGNEQAVKLMIDRCQYEADEKDSCGATPLMDALRSGHIRVAKHLIDGHAASLVTCDVLGRQPIHLVAQAGCLDTMEFLVELHDVDPTIAVKSTGRTALHIAAKEGHNDIVQYLGCYGVCIDAQDRHKRTASGHAECASKLLHLGADPTLKDCNGHTPMELSINISVREVFESHR